MDSLGIIVLVIFIKYAYVWLLKKITKPTFVGKTIWITGASSGIGEQLAKDLSKLGANLILSSHQIQDLERVKQECFNPKKVSLVVLDMSELKNVLEKTDDIIKKLEEKGEKLDIVIENAGVSMRCEFKDNDYENHKYLTNVNYNGPVAHVKSILPHFLKNKVGHIVLMNSISGLLSTGMRTSYAGSKHGLRGFFDSLRAEVLFLLTFENHYWLVEDNIKVTTIYPGFVNTQVSKNSLTGQKGQTFGKMDVDVNGGESVSSFASKAILAIFRQVKDEVITQKFSHYIAISLRNVSFDFIHYMTHKNFTTQKEALKKAI